MNVSPCVRVPGTKRACGPSPLLAGSLECRPRQHHAASAAKRSDVAMLEVMAARLGAVATRAHVAPAPRCVPALIEKEPATRVVGALAHAAGSRGNDEIGGGPKHGSQQLGR